MFLVVEHFLKRYNYLFLQKLPSLRRISCKDIRYRINEKHVCLRLLSQTSDQMDVMGGRYQGLIHQGFIRKSLTLQVFFWHAYEGNNLFNAFAINNCMLYADLGFSQSNRKEIKD